MRSRHASRLPRVGRSLARLTSCLTILAVSAAASASAAAGSQVEAYAAGGPAFQPKESYIFADILFFGQAECVGTDELASMGTNPDKTLKVTGSNRDESNKVCEDASGITNGALKMKSVSVAHSGKVSVKLEMAVETANGCHYELKSVTGTQSFGGTFGVAAEVQAKLQKSVKNPSGCTKTITGEAEIAVGTSTFDQFDTIKLT
jgi:hypothetical protein